MENKNIIIKEGIKYNYLIQMLLCHWEALIFFKIRMDANNKCFNKFKIGKMKFLIVS